MSTPFGWLGQFREELRQDPVEFQRCKEGLGCIVYLSNVEPTTGLTLQETLESLGRVEGVAALRSLTEWILKHQDQEGNVTFSGKEVLKYIQGV